MDFIFNFLVRTIEELLGFRKRIKLTREHKACLRFLNKTNKHIFITGKAGTGKSLLIDYFRENTKKNVVVLAPTGLAALNIRGQTIGSFFHFPPRVIDKHAVKKQYNRKLYTRIDTIIIDEASMLRADVLDGIDHFMRLNGRSATSPFGGVQIVLVGDMFQLPPVVTREENKIYKLHYDTPYFFSARVFEKAGFSFIEMKTVFRQKEREFIESLNAIRLGDISDKILNQINKRVIHHIPDTSYVVLCPTNKAVSTINQTRLGHIKFPQYTYTASTEGKFRTKNRYLPVKLELKLKVGARVLFVKNDRKGRWVNGTLGVVHKLHDDRIQVKIDGRKKVVDVAPEYWENIKYGVNRSGKIETSVLGRLYQYPLKLAWAITIHKSQGMSFDRVCVDLSHSPFATGQTYVALSRSRTIDGIALTRRIKPRDILIDDRIIEFYRKIFGER
ncbi:ATP-dependent RecD-like DNA helicase [Patescibacteria group bacterium]